MSTEPRRREQPARPGGRARRFGFLLVPNFSLIALSSAVDPLRLANAAAGRTVFEWVTVGLTQDPILSSDGIRILPDQTTGQSDHFSAVFVVGPNPIPKRGASEATRWLRMLAQRGIALGGIDTGSYYLAKAGLLKGYRCTIHWEDREALLEQFPDLIVSSRIFEIDRDRYTCSGGVSPLDLMTYILGQPPGSRALAQQVSDLLIAHQRNPQENQSLPTRYRYANLPAPVIEALEIMESNIEDPLRPDEIATVGGMSRRQLERLFQAYLQESPARKYLEIRLNRARVLVLRTTRSIEDIALSCGFATASHFVTRYSATFGSTPHAERVIQSRTDLHFLT